MRIQGTGRLLVELKRSALVLGAIALSIPAVGCGKGKSLVKSADVSTYTEANQVYTQLSLGLDTGAVQLPSLVFPVLNPHDPLDQVGKISLLQALGSGTQLNIALNLSRIVQIPGDSSALLPNGEPIPLGVPAGVSIFSFPVAGSSVRAYLALGPHVALFGAALPIREFLQLGQLFGQLSVFPSFSQGKFTGVAGLFLSPEAGRNGFAVFADLSQVLSPAEQRPIVPGWSPPSDADQKVVFDGRMPDAKTRREIFNRMNEIGKKSGVVTIE